MNKSSSKISDEMTNIVGAIMSRRSRFGDAEREGQMAMNALHEVRPDLYERIMNEDGPDPFYDNNKLPDFWNWVGDALMEEVS